MLDAFKEANMTQKALLSPRGTAKLQHPKGRLSWELELQHVRDMHNFVRRLMQTLSLI